jgi:predicted nucleic acid-binding Zn ribbon protein
MTCPKCKSEQPDTTKFCSECAEQLARGNSPSRAKSNPWLWFVLVLIVIALVLVVVNIYNNEQKRTVTFVSRAVGVPPVILPQPHYVPITNGAATVNASRYVWYTFVVPPGANTIAVNGHFTATGGAGNHIACYILDEDGFVNFKNGHPTNTYFNSGKVTTAKIGGVLGTPGTYHLILDNRFSALTPKAVQIEATLSYIQ